MNDLVLVALCLALFVAVVALSVELRRRAKQARSGRTGELPPPPAEPAEAAQNHNIIEILERMGEGVLLLDADMHPVFANSAARNMLGFQTPLPERLPSEGVRATAARALAHENAEDIIQVWFPLPMNLRVRATLADRSGVIVVLQNVTEEVLAQRVRREFVAHASHELKTPVASIQALAEAVHDAVDDDPAAVEMFSQRMIEEADRLGRLVGDLLDLSRLEEPTNAPKEPADLSAITRHELECLRPSAKAKSITLAAGIDDDIWLTGDEQHLGLMVRNLLENAIRYTATDGNVALEVFQSGGTAYVVVRDDGIGIPREAHARVFERFYRVDRARARDKGGTGLGLAIVKHVAEMHGGRVSLSSELGQGSTFTAQLPAMAAGDRNPRADSLAG